MAETKTTVKVSRTLLNKLKSIIDVEDTMDTYGTALEKLVDTEWRKYAYTHKGLAKVGDKLQLAYDSSSPKFRQLSDEVATIVRILPDEVWCSNGVAYPTTIIYWSEPYAN